MMAIKTKILVYRYSSVDNSRHIWTLLNFLSKAGFDVTLISGESCKNNISGIDSSINIIPLNAKSFSKNKISRLTRTSQKLRKILKNETFDILYVVDSWSLLSLFAAMLGRFRSGAGKLVYHTFDWLEPGLVSRIHTSLEKRICRQANLVVNTDRSRARLQQTIYNLKDTPLAIQNALSCNEEIPEPSQEVRKKLAGPAASGKEIIVIYPTAVSDSVSSERMTYELIESMALLSDNYRLVVFYKEGTEYERCLKKVKDDKLASRVLFLKPVPFNVLMEYLVNADIGAIFYDDTRSSGYYMCNADKLSLLIAARTPYVASALPNLESITYKHKLGLCCDSRDPESISNAIKELSEGEIPLSERKSLARSVFEDQLCFEKHGELLVSALRKL